jgi:competence protein ComEA
MTPAERKALLFFAAVGALGAGVRVAGGADGARAQPTAQERRALDAQLAAVDSAKAVAEARKAERRRRRRAPADAPPPADPRWPPVVRTPTVIRGPAMDAGARAGEPAPRGRRRRSAAASSPAPAFPIDVDVADAATLEALPGIGPALAGRIVEERARGGAFGSLEGLRRVRGVGPKVAERLAAAVTFSGIPRPSSAGAGPRAP